MDDPVEWSVRAPSHRSFVATLVGCGFMLAAGIAAGLYGHSLPVFKVDFGTAQQAFMAWCTDEPRVDAIAGDHYFALFTNHYAWVDTGIGLVLSAVTIASGAFVLRYRNQDASWLRTPAYRWTYLVLGTGVLLWFFGAIIRSFSIDFDRMFLPWCADSIGIPIFSTAIIASVAIPVAILAGWVVTRLFGTLPVPLRQWDDARPVRSWVMTLVFGVAILCVGALLVDTARDSTSGASPALIGAIYLLASTRAALLSPKQGDAAKVCR